jgi:predicted RNA-binding Zn-ribbon protein involved in translation (DUF1610 family)
MCHVEENCIVSDVTDLTKGSGSETWVRVCPRCLSTQIDLHLYGRYSQQLYKCMDCEYVGIDFIQVNLPTLEKMKAINQSQQGQAAPQLHQTEMTTTIIEYCCPHCGARCTEAEIPQGFCVKCNR